MRTLLALSASLWPLVASAAEFVNVVFDQPDVSRMRTNASTGLVFGPVEDLLRGWEVSIREPFGEWNRFREEIPFVFDGGGAPPIALDRGLHVDQTDLSVAFNSLAVIGDLQRTEPPDVRLITKGIVPLDANYFEWDRGFELEATMSDGTHQISTVGNLGLLKVSKFAGKEVTIQFVLRSGGYGKLDVFGFTQTAREFPISPSSKLTLTSNDKESLILS